MPRPSTTTTSTTVTVTTANIKEQLSLVPLATDPITTIDHHQCLGHCELKTVPAINTNTNTNITLIFHF